MVNASYKFCLLAKDITLIQMGNLFGVENMLKYANLYIKA